MGTFRIPAVEKGSHKIWSSYLWFAMVIFVEQFLGVLSECQSTIWGNELQESDKKKLNKIAHTSSKRWSTLLTRQPLDNS